MVIDVPADVLAPRCARSWAGTVMNIKFAMFSSIFTGYHSLHTPLVTRWSNSNCCKPYPWFPRITWFAWRIDAHWVIAMDIPIRHGYFVFRVALRPRIMQSARDIAPLAQSIIFIVARIASWNEPCYYYGFRAPGAVRVMTRRNPKGELPLCQAIFTAGSITYPAHPGHILCLICSRMPLKDAIIEPEYDRVW